MLDTDPTAEVTSGFRHTACRAGALDSITYLGTSPPGPMFAGAILRWRGFAFLTTCVQARKNIVNGSRACILRVLPWSLGHIPSLFKVSGVRLERSTCHHARYASI